MKINHTTVTTTEVDLLAIPISGWPEEARLAAREELSINRVRARFLELPLTERKAFLVDRVEANLLLAAEWATGKYWSP